MLAYRATFNVNQHLHSVPPYKNRIRIRVFLHRFLQALSQIFLMRRVLDDRYP